VVSALVLVFALLALGYVLGRARVFADADAAADALNRYVVYVCLPALVLVLVPKLRWEPALWFVVATPWAMLAIGVACVLAAARVFGWPRPVIGALLLCAPLGNTSFVGIPLIEALRGEHAVRYAIVYDQFGSFLALSTFGLVAIARYAGEAAPSAAAVAARVLRFPPFVALLAALVPFSHPQWLDAALQRVADTLVPVAVFAVGLRLKLRPPADRSALFAGLGIKMLLCPLLAFAALRALGAHALPAQVAVLESAMPPMISAGALASMAGLAPELCAALVGYGVVLAFATLPLWNALL
jgi:predicted permease